MTPRTKEQNEEIRLRRLAHIRKAAADVFLSKGSLLEIRDVAEQGGLGYGTVYHYYNNKSDLLQDLLWDALERAGGWLEALLIASHTGASFSESRETAASVAELGPIAAASVRLLQLWAEDHALYLLHKLAVEDFAALPEARSTLLADAFRREALAPIAALLEIGHATGESAASVSVDNASGSPNGLQRAEMLLAALVGCASLSLRRGKLHEEAVDIVRFLKL